MSVRLECGDCLEIMRSMADASVDMVLADPPYGARRPSARRSANKRFAEVPGNDAVRTGWLAEAFRVLTKGGAAYVFACWDRLEQWRAAIARAGFRVRSCIVWDKEIHGLADLSTCWAPRHELILFAAKGRHLVRRPRPADVIRCPRVPAQRLTHPYEKPTKLLARLIVASTDPGMTVLDPFVGSGATAEACVDTGRQFIGYDIDPACIALADRRLSATSRLALA